MDVNNLLVTLSTMCTKPLTLAQTVKLKEMKHTNIIIYLRYKRKSGLVFQYSYHFYCVLTPRVEMFWKNFDNKDYLYQCPKQLIRIYVDKNIIRLGFISNDIIEYEFNANDFNVFYYIKYLRSHMIPPPNPIEDELNIVWWEDHCYPDLMNHEYIKKELFYEDVYDSKMVIVKTEKKVKIKKSIDSLHEIVSRYSCYYHGVVGLAYRNVCYKEFRTIQCYRLTYKNYEN